MEPRRCPLPPCGHPLPPFGHPLPAGHLRWPGERGGGDEGFCPSKDGFPSPACGGRCPKGGWGCLRVRFPPSSAGPAEPGAGEVVPSAALSAKVLRRAICPQRRTNRRGCTRRCPLPPFGHPLPAGHLRWPGERGGGDEGFCPSKDGFPSPACGGRCRSSGAPAFALVSVCFAGAQQDRADVYMPGCRLRAMHDSGPMWFAEPPL